MISLTGQVFFCVLKAQNRDDQRPRIQDCSERATAEVIFTQPYPIGTLSQSESIPLTSALKYIILQHVHTYWLHFHWKHCRGVCVWMCVLRGGAPFVLVLLSAREISIFIMLLSHSVLKWYQDVIKSLPHSILFYCIQSPDIREIDGTNILSHLSRIQITLQVKQRQWGQLVIC